MGELLLCHETIAALPYYIEETGINIYSMEELSYYISGNVYLLDHSFMCESLCTWVEKQMHRVELAQKLRENIRTEGKLSDFVFAILQDTAYCTMKEMQEIVFAVRQMEQKSDFERDKIRADQLMEKEKYLAAIYRYKHLLDEADTKETGEVLRGNIWHNLGTAYARLFLFEEAGRCFEKAYAFNKQKESLRECLMCCRCRHDEEAFAEIAKKYQVEERKQQEIRNETNSDLIEKTLSKRRDLVYQEEIREQEIRKELTKKLGHFAYIIEKNINLVTYLDLLIAKAKLAKDYKCNCPKITDTYEIHLDNMNNPYFNSILKGNRL